MTDLTKKIDKAIEMLTDKSSGDEVAADAALKYSQAALNLAHARNLIKD